MFLIVFACVCLLCLLPLLGFACLALFYLVVFAWGPAGESLLLANPVFSMRLLLVIPDHFGGGFGAPLHVFSFHPPAFIIVVLSLFKLPPAAVSF